MEGEMAFDAGSDGESLRNDKYIAVAKTLSASSENLSQ